jgi:hypothetical protein
LAVASAPRLSNVYVYVPDMSGLAHGATQLVIAPSNHHRKDGSLASLRACCRNELRSTASSNRGLAGNQRGAVAFSSAFQSDTVD